MGRFIPLSIPNFEGNERKYVDDAVSQGWVSTGGAYITQLEDKIAEYINVDCAVACQSGTSAIHLSLIEAGVMPGDMVIVPTLTFIAAVNPVRYQFAEPIFMDCDDSLCMDPMKLEKFLKEECEIKDDILLYKKNSKRIKALIVVHVFGNMADMENIMRLAENYHFRVIEDATEALGTRYTSGKYEGKYAGTIGDFGAFSFNGNKIITTGGGGAVVSKNKKELEHIKYISTQAKDDSLFYIHNEVGYNYRMTNVQGALGVAQMECLEEFIKRKQKNYNKYIELFEKNKHVQLLDTRENVDSNRWFYALYINDVDKNSIKDIIEKLHSKGVQTRPIWGLIHEQLPYKEYDTYKIEKAKYYSEHIINIPCSTNLSEEDVEYVVTAIEKVVK